jgi:REP element-mobilizing transposase RayT
MSTYASLNYHFVFSTKLRVPSIEPGWQSRLYAYIAGTLRGIGGTSLAIGGIADHIRIVAALKPTHQMADVMQKVKKSSSSLVHDEIGKSRFAWQEGYAALTVSSHEIDIVKSYIAGQEVHHRAVDSRTEILALCKEAGVEVDLRYFE